MAWPVNARTSAMLDEAQALYGATITATQGSPHPGVGASFGTHDGEGVIDVVGADLDAIVIAMRQVGFAAWHRTPAQGFAPHVHGVAIGEPLLSPQAATQVESYFSGHNGLRNNDLDDGPRDWVGVTWETYSGGTYVPPTGGTGGTPVTIFGQFPGDRAGTSGDFPDAIITGTPTLDGGSTFYHADIDSTDVTLHMDAGDSCYLSLLEDWSYYSAEQDLTKGFWLVKYTGTGTLAVADDWDEGYLYPSGTPVWTGQSFAGTAGGLDYFTMNPVMLDLSHLYNDGSPLIRLTCTSGSVDITWVGMQIQVASGYFEQESTAWSPNQPPSAQEPAMNGFGTYHKHLDGGVLVWDVDGQPGQALGGPGYDAWTGSAFSYVDAQTARDDSIANFGPWTTFGNTAASADLVHSPGGGLFGDPEQWDANLMEQAAVFTAPSKALMPTAPDGYFSIPPYLRDGFDGYEWLDTDTSLMGWRVFGGNVEFSGDTDTYRLYLTEVTDGFDTSASWFSGGTVLVEQTVGDVDPFGDPELYAIPDSFLTTSTQLMALRLTLGREATDQLSFWTVENGYSAGNSGTSVIAGGHTIRARFRIPGWRYRQPTFISIPGPAPVIDFDEDPSVTWLRQRQRDDGLGSSVVRAKRGSSRQLSLRQRGYR